MENKFKYYNTQSFLGVIAIPIDNINDAWSNPDKTLIFSNTTARWIKTEELYYSYDEAKKEQKHNKIKSIKNHRKI